MLGLGGGLYSPSRYYDVFILHHSVLHHRDMDALLDELMIMASFTLYDYHRVFLIPLCPIHYVNSSLESNKL